MKYVLAFFAIHFFFTISMGLLVNERINFKNVKFYIYFLITLVLLVLNFEYSPSFLRVIINPFIYMLFANLNFKKNIRESVLLGILIVILGVISELIYNVVAFPILSHESVIEQDSYLVFINNFFIGLLLFFICHWKKTGRLYDNIVLVTSKISDMQILLFSVIVITLCNFVWWLSYFISKDLVSYSYLMIASSLLSVFGSLLVLFYLKINNKYLTFYEKYNVSLESIREFEMTLERYRINTHENRNQLLTIRNMSNNKKIIAYIDALLEDDITDDEKLLLLSQKIPAGGLRGIVYSKLLVMQQKNIPFELVVDRKITTDKVEKVDDYTLTDICRILGVLLDNSIEEVKKLSDQNIMVELYEEDNDIVISITNNYEGYVDIDSMNNPGISTKGKNHGYGLALVQNIVKKNKKIKHSSEFFEDNFMQKIKIKV